MVAVGQHRGAEHLKFTVFGFVFLRTAQFLVCLFIHFQYEMPGLSLSCGPVDGVHWPGRCPGQDLCAAL